MRNTLLLSALSLLFCICPSMKGNPSTMTHRATFCHRIHPERYMDEKKLEEFFSALQSGTRHGELPGVMFFTQNSHSSLRLEYLKPRAEMISKAIIRARKLGMPTGINVLCTLGHLKEQLDMTPGNAMRQMQDMQGNTAWGCYCPNDPRTREYIRKVYELFSKCNPDEIWVDDDLRMYGHTVAECCFCDECIARFNRENGTAFTRDSLRDAFHKGTPEEKIAIRSRWTAHNGKILTEILALIEKTIHGISPETRIGVMTGMRGYDNFEFAAYAKTAAGDRHIPVMWRPGGGMYHDRIPTAIMGKATVIGIQCSFLPPEVQDIRSELECFPYQTMRKSRHMVGMEIFSYIASGCTGTALNVTGDEEPMSVYMPLLEELDRQRPFFDQMVRASHGKPLVGIGGCWNRLSFAGAMLDGNWPRGDCNGELFLAHTEECFMSGLPLGFDHKSAPVRMLTGNQVHTLSDEELADILSGGVLMDVPALQLLHARGFGEDTGFTPGRVFPENAIARLTGNGWSTTFAGLQRDARQSFNREKAYEIIPMPGSVVLAELTDYSGRKTSPCVMGYFHNKRGGRVAVAGYFPWKGTLGASYNRFMKELLWYLSNGKVPAMVLDSQPMGLWYREGCIALLNLSMDSINPKLRLAVPGGTWELLRSNGERSLLSFKDGNLILPELAPWEYCLVLKKKTGR